MKLSHSTKQKRNLRWVIFGLILLLSLACLSLFSQQTTKESIRQLDRSRFSLTAQCIESADSSQVGWDYLRSPLMAKLTNRGLYIFYGYRDYKVTFPITNKLKTYYNKDFAGNIVYNKTSTGIDKWSHEIVEVKQWYTISNPNGHLELYFPERELVITYKIQFNHLTSNLMKVIEKVEKQIQFTIILESPGEKRTDTIRAVKGFSDGTMSLMQSKKLVDDVPSIIKEYISENEANAMKEEFEKVGAVVTIK